MSSERSTPSTRPSAPTRSAAGKSVAPRPQPTSSTDSPGRRSAKSTSRAPNSVKKGMTVSYVAAARPKTPAISCGS